MYFVRSEGDMWRVLMKYRRANQGRSPTVVRCHPQLSVEVQRWNHDWNKSFGIKHVAYDPTMGRYEVVFGDLITIQGATR